MPEKNNLLKFLFFLLIVKPFVFLALGINARGLKKLPDKGACIIAANHNSHIDTLLLMSLFSSLNVLKVHPAAAEDYFCSTKFKEWIFKSLIGIIPIKRNIGKTSKTELFKNINEALKDGEIVIIYPEGTRGSSSALSEFKTGIGHIAGMNPDVPVIPVYISGPDKILPKAESLLVPFISDIYIDDAVYYDNTSAKLFTQKIRSRIENMYLNHKKKNFEGI